MANKIKGIFEPFSLFVSKQLELRKKRLEVLKLQQELEALKRLNEAGGVEFEN